jgi:class 3 adenylate cyclase/tetratricopeptide (TPR) repeat protein
MKCPECDSHVRKGAKFCRKCGTELFVVCPQCRGENLLGDDFCEKCNSDLRRTKETSFAESARPHSYTPKFLADKILKSRTSIEGERKVVTVLFADVANYTSMADKLDSEEVHQIMEGCFKILMDQIHEYEGTINQFTGDGIMALFGAPLAREDHAQKACHAALAIQRALTGYDEELETEFGLEFKMRIGLNSGPVVVGSIGDDLRMDYTAVGDTTNLAARMESMATPGTVMVSPNTYKKVSQYFELKPLGKVEVKGKKEPLEAYELVQEKAYRPRLGLERFIYSEMVGRDEELAKLELHVLKTVNGEGSVVTITGEAGIGKSRLVAELKKRDVMKYVTLLEGRAISIGRNLSFHPINDVLKQWARIKEDDREADALDKLKTAIRNLSSEDVDEVLPFVATLMGMRLSGRHAEKVKGIEGEALEKRISKNVRHLLVRATMLNPLVIVMEDFHWADTSSVELMESLFRLVETHRVLFLNVFRPCQKETSDRMLEKLRENLPQYHTEIVLQPLDEQMSEVLIRNMLKVKGLDHPLLDRIVQRAGGNPFFIEEVVRSLIDEGAVVVTDGAFRVTEKMETMVIPHTINDVLMARIDRLEEKTRNLLKVASVIGRSFFYRILAEVERMVEDIDSRLSYLKEIQLIRERKRMEELEYLFKHALAQEAAYDSILVQKRKKLHVEVAHSIEKVFKERLYEFYGMLAFHYCRGEDEEKAEEYLIRAGEEALKSSASSEALYYYREALNLYLKKCGDAADPGKVAMLEKNIALALFNRGQFVEAVEYFDKTLAYYGEKSPKHLISVLLRFVGCFLDFLISLYIPSLKWRRIPTQRDIEIISLFYKKLEMLAVTDPKRMFIESFYFLKMLTGLRITELEHGVGMFAANSIKFSWPGISFKLSQRILEFSREKVNKNDSKSVMCYEFADLLHNFLIGNWGAVNDYDDDLVNKNLLTGEVFFSSIYVGFRGEIYCEQGCLDRAQKMVDKLSEIAEVYENDYSRTRRNHLKTILLVKYRRFSEALFELEEAITVASKGSLKRYVNFFYALKARVQIMLNDISGAEDSLAYAEEYQSEVEAVPYYHSWFLTGQFIFDLYRLEESKKADDRSAFARNQKSALRVGRIAIQKSWKVASNRTETYKLMGNYYWITGKQKKALECWSRSVAEGERIVARLELSRTHMEVGNHLLETRSNYNELNGIRAEEYLERARKSFEEMGLQWDLDELEKTR